MSSSSESDASRPPELFEQLVRQRRAISRFTDDPVSESVLNRILRDATHAPSGFNLQPWRFLVLRHGPNRDLLRAAAHDQPEISQAPVVIVAYAPHHEWRDRMQEIFAEAVRCGAMRAEDMEQRKRSAESFVDGLPLSVWLNRQVMIAFTYLMLSAEAHGFDTAPFEGFDPEHVKTVCRFPLETEVVALLAIGRAEEPRPPFPGRLPVSQIVSEETVGTPWLG